MAQTDLFIKDLVSIYRQKQPSDTFLRGSLAIPSWIQMKSISEIYKMIMPRLVEVFPEIERRWGVSRDITMDSLAYFCLIRDDDPDELAAIEYLERYED